MKQGTIVDVATDWVTETTPTKLAKEWYCSTRDVFQVRLQTFLSHIQKHLGENAYLLTAIVGEIGNNSFDHNLGNWHDVPGVFFTYVQEIKTVVLADRGQGIRQTISRVMPQIKEDHEALTAAFTRILSGRLPERRGNGLKFVVHVLKEHHWSLTFRSGDAELTIKSGAPLQTRSGVVQIHGCLAILNY